MTKAVFPRLSFSCVTLLSIRLFQAIVLHIAINSDDSACVLCGRPIRSGCQPTRVPKKYRNVVKPFLTPRHRKITCVYLLGEIGGARECSA